MKPAFGYLRVSGRGQLSGDGFDRQQAEIERYATAKGFFIARWFKDGAVSGTVDVEDRSGFAEMVSLAGDATTKVIIVERADRLARDLIVSELALEEARKSGLTIFEAASDTDLTCDNADPTRVLIRQVLGALSQWNKNVIVQRLSKARGRKREKTGRCEGRRKFFERDPEQLETLLLIIKWRDEGISYREIARDFNRTGRKTPNGAVCWHPSSIQFIYESKKGEERMKRIQSSQGNEVKGETLVNGLSI